MTTLLQDAIARATADVGRALSARPELAPLPTMQLPTAPEKLTTHDYDLRGKLVAPDVFPYLSIRGPYV